MSKRTASTAVAVLLLTALPTAALLPSASATNFAVLFGGSGNVTGQMSTSFGPDGSGVAAWSSDDGGTYGFHVSRFNPGQGWSPTFVLSGRASSPAAEVDTAVTPDGFLAVCWSESSPARTQAAVFDPATGWEPVQQLNLSVQPTADCRVTASGNGAFVFLYRDNVNDNMEPVARGWRSGVRWMAPESLRERPNYVAAADLAGDGKGGATVVWVEQNSTSADMFAATIPPAWAPGQTTITRAHVGTFPGVTLTGTIEALRFERGASGQGAAGVIVENPGGPGAANASLFVSVLDSSDAWGSLDVVSDPAVDVAIVPFSLFPEVDDQVLVVFQNGDPSRPIIAGSIWNSNGTGPTWVPLFDLAPTRTGQLGASSYLAGGVPAVAWTESNAVETTLFTSTFDSRTGWSEPFHPAPDDRDMRSPAIASSPLGDAWVVFADRDLRARAVQVPDVMPPDFELLSPAEGQTFDKASCWIRVSQVPMGGSMSANGVRGELQPDGTSAALVPLENGSNRIFVVVTDGNGNRATATVNVTFVDPVPGLQEQLNLTAAELENATAAATDYFLKIDGIEGEANATAAELNETKQQLANVTHEMGHWLDLHNESLDLIANLSADLNETQQNANGSVPMDEITLNFGKIEAELNDTKLALSESQAAQQQQETDLAFLRQRAEDASSAASLATMAAVAGVALGAVGIATGLRGRGGPSFPEKGIKKK